MSDAKCKSGHCYSHMACNILNCIRVHPLFDANLEYKLAFVPRGGLRSLKIILADFENKQPPKVSREFANKYNYAERCGFPLPIPPKTKLGKRPASMKRAEWAKVKEKWEFNKRPNETLAEAEQRRETMSQFLERIKR